MRKAVECAGCPRDQGLDQGNALRSEIRDAIARAGVPKPRRRGFGLAALTRGPVLGRGAGREILRHHTQLAERTDGIARAADLSLAALVELSFVAPGLLAEAAAVSARGGDRPLLSRSLAESPVPSARWQVRRSRPDVGFPSVEVTLPHLSGAAAGLNTVGLAVALVPGATPSGAALLLQECLQHFEDCDACLDWCVKRPAPGDGGLVFADARGRVASIGLMGSDCRAQPAGERPIDLGPAALLASLATAPIGPTVVRLDPHAPQLSLGPAQHFSPPGDERERANGADPNGGS